ncbi:MAG: protocatechuate 3,4-dioxygenase subunit alpha [Acetobacteraceae bacterium]|nr:protocatechuate 3,4-dioxygenase subunit alpha [Acetobacteraceae bacterium]
MTKLRQTPSQTVGPYFAYGLSPEQYGYQHGLTSIAGHDMAAGDVEGQQIRIEGRVFDGAGNVISDALIEVWQADALGRYAHPADPRGSNSNFKGFGRCGTGTDPQNRFWFDTIKPGAPEAGQAPHLSVIVTMRGMLLHAFTRIYFSDEASANAADKVLNAVPAERRNTLIATKRDGNVYRFDIHMQGDNETVFFDA